MEPCYPCIKSKEFFINIKIEFKFVGGSGGGSCPLCPPGSGTRVPLNIVKILKCFTTNDGYRLL